MPYDQASGLRQADEVVFLGDGAGWIRNERRKHVVGKRLKQSGMIWKRSGSSAILALRIAWLNRQWDQLWAGKPLAA